MINNVPHYLLYCETGRKDDPGRWRFVLRAVGAVDQFEAADAEPEVYGERLELLTVVRGLEALDQPSRVTLMTPDPYVRQGIRYGLPEWRSNGWRWESYGQMVPVKHADLWLRMDRALRIHEVELCSWRVDRAHPTVGAPQSFRRDANGHSGNRLAPLDRLRRYGAWWVGQGRRLYAAALRWCSRHSTRRLPFLSCSRLG